MAKFMMLPVIIGIVSVLIWVLKLFYGIWWKPKMLERYLRKQGVFGPSYQIYHGNMKEESKLGKEARSKPMNLSHDIGYRVNPFIHQVIHNYGKMSCSWFGTALRVYIMDPELIRDIFASKFGHFEKIKIHPLKKLFTIGLANVEREQWAKHRRIINPAFHVEKLKSIFPTFLNCCKDMVNRWEKLIPLEGSCELDVWPEVQNLTVDVISRAAFGTSFEEGKQIFQLQYEHTVNVLQILQSLYIPGFRFLPTKRNIRMKEIDRTVRSLLRGIINKREKAMKSGEANTDDLLGSLMESNFKEIHEHGNHKDGMSMDDVIEECKLFYFAGQETTSNLLLWTMVVLSKHTDWQERARKEILDVFGNNEPKFEGLNNLKIVTMILYEVLRLYPPVATLARSTYKEIKLGKLSLPPGVEVFIPVILIHHDPELWGEDANEFKPERFAEGISKATKNQVSFIPFGFGPRLCIGQNFALMEAKIALSVILRRFSFELSPSYAHAPATILTLRPQYGAPIILHKL